MNSRLSSSQLFNRETERNFAALEERLKELARLCDHVCTEQRTLREQQVQLLAERESLRLESQQARRRIEAMVARLQGLEDDR